MKIKDEYPATTPTPQVSIENINEPERPDEDTSLSSKVSVVKSCTHLSQHSKSDIRNCKSLTVVASTRLNTPEYTSSLLSEDIPDVGNLNERVTKTVDDDISSMKNFGCCTENQCLKGFVLNHKIGEDNSDVATPIQSARTQKSDNVSLYNTCNYSIASSMPKMLGLKGHEKKLRLSRLGEIYKHILSDITTQNQVINDSEKKIRRLLAQQSLSMYDDLYLSELRSTVTKTHCLLKKLLVYAVKIQNENPNFKWLPVEIATKFDEDIIPLRYVDSLLISTDSKMMPYTSKVDNGCKVLFRNSRKRIKKRSKHTKRRVGKKIPKFNVKDEKDYPTVRKFKSVIKFLGRCKGGMDGGPSFDPMMSRNNIDGRPTKSRRRNLNNESPKCPSIPTARGMGVGPFDYGPMDPLRLQNHGSRENRGVNNAQGSLYEGNCSNCGSGNGWESNGGGVNRRGNNRNRAGVVGGGSFGVDLSGGQSSKKYETTIADYQTMLIEVRKQLEEYRCKYLDAMEIIEEQKCIIKQSEYERQEFEALVCLEVQHIIDLYEKQLVKYYKYPQVVQDFEDLVMKLKYDKQQLEIRLSILCREYKLLEGKYKTDCANKDIGSNSQCPDCSTLKSELDAMTIQFNDLKKQYDALQKTIAALKDAHQDAIAALKERFRNTELMLKREIDKLEKLLAEARGISRCKERSHEKVIKELNAKLSSLALNFNSAQKQIHFLKSIPKS